jgi:hypothetical protein
MFGADYLGNSLFQSPDVPIPISVIAQISGRVFALPITPPGLFPTCVANKALFANRRLGLP